MKILLVDDEQGIRRMLSDYLVSLDHQVLTAENGGEALEIIQEQKENLNLLIIDNKMPVMDGISLLREIQPLGLQAPIIMMTGHSDLEKRAVTELGVFEVIEKPFSFRDLTAVLEVLPGQAQGESQGQVSP